MTLTFAANLSEATSVYAITLVRTSILLASVVFTSMPAPASAQPTEGAAPLSLRELGASPRLNPGAKARYFSQPRGGKISDSPQDVFMSQDALELSLDSEEIVRSQKQDSLSVSYYRNLQSRRVWDDNPNSPKYDELDSESFAQHLGLFFSTKNFIDLLRQSEFGTLYRDVSSTVKRASNFATVSAGRNSAGEVEFNHGEAKRGRLFDLRLGLSTHNGLEPKLKLPKDLSVKYDLHSGSALLEYEINF